MAVPVPISLELAPPPTGWTATAPDQLTELIDLIVDNLTASMDVELLTGQLGGSAPSGNVGPWLNNNEWYVYNPSTGQYQESQQGCPIGTIAIWGSGNPNSVPANWILCQGQNLPVSQFRLLYQAIGNTWGGGSGSFNLPPSAKFFVNQQGFAPATSVPLDPNSPGSGLGCRGGSQIALLAAANIPRLKIQVPYLSPGILDGNGPNVPNVNKTGDGYLYRVTDEKGVLVGTNQQPISIMPPFVVAYFMIKYQ